MRILTLDGGGIRGLWTARVLHRLELAQPGFLASIDLFAGTSTGGILALGLALGLSLAMIEQFYLSQAAKIFNASFEHRVEALGELREPKYDNAGLRAALTNIFGTRCLGDLPREVLVTTYDCINRVSVDMTRAAFANLLCVDAVLRTSAAETYFPAYQGCVDGGTSANNPSMVAVAWAISHGRTLGDLRLLSIGTGNADRPPLDPDNWGAVQWIEHGLINLLMSAPSQRNDQYCQEMLGPNYCRVDGSVDCALDETRDLTAKLIMPADALDLADAVKFIETVYARS